ncbi:hypothetical protein DRO69_12360 [Candidatus Bathyarchaeota archaeon]|nr:MAG: hypothetical protein DRO69_12360 [Candidatus Bathyarchaeota archaeon]
MLDEIWITIVASVAGTIIGMIIEAVSGFFRRVFVPFICYLIADTWIIGSMEIPGEELSSGISKLNEEETKERIIISGKLFGEKGNQTLTSVMELFKNKNYQPYRIVASRKGHSGYYELEDFKFNSGRVWHSYRMVLVKIGTTSTLKEGYELKSFKKVPNDWGI